MPRTKRVIYDGAIYHIINRGHNRQVLFCDSEDFIVFKEFISFYADKYQFKLYNYCLMSNHFHFIIRIDKGEYLSKIMQGISQRYAGHYRKKYKGTGFLFQNRYKSILIERDEYLLECARYIERNPVRAGIVKEVDEYLWSSYNYYAKGNRDAIITNNVLYQELGKNKLDRQKEYISYISESRPYEELLDKVLVAS